MKRRNLKILVFLALTVTCGDLYAQMPNFFGAPTPTTPANTGATAKPASGATTSGTAGTAGTGSATKPSAGNTGAVPPIVEKAPAGGGAQLTGSQPISIPVPMYDPYMDNHLKAPEREKPLGLFGMPVKKVEELLKNHGAKNHSYAFGKYSRLTISAYLVTIFFDRTRKVGGFLVEPRLPYKTVEPDAREFFMETFLKGADLSKFAITMASDRLEVQYAP